MGGQTAVQWEGLTASSWCAEVPPPAASGRSGRRSGTDRGSRLPTPSPHWKHTHTQAGVSEGRRGGPVVSDLLGVRTPLHPPHPPNAAALAVRCDVMRCDGGSGIAGKCQVNMCHSPQGLCVCVGLRRRITSLAGLPRAHGGFRSWMVFIPVENFDFFLWIFTSGTFHIWLYFVPVFIPAAVTCSFSAQSSQRPQSPAQCGP